jgi:hypothetical protein
MSLTVPFRASSQPADGDVSAGEPPVLRLGRLDLGSALAYLLLWSAVLFVVEVLVLWSSHEALLRTGVLASISQAVATVLDLQVPETGVLPALEFGALLPWLLLAAAAFALLWLVTSLAVVLVHNGICAVTGGPRVRVR